MSPATRFSEGEQDGQLSRLIREGIVRPGRLTPIQFAVRRSATASRARRFGRGSAPCRATGQPVKLPLLLAEESTRRTKTSAA